MEATTVTGSAVQHRNSTRVKSRFATRAFRYVCATSRCKTLQPQSNDPVWT